MFSINGDEDDEETKALDKKVEETLRTIAKLSAEAPETLAKIAVESLKASQKPDGTFDFKPLLDGAKKFYESLPNITAILGQWTGTLSGYASYRVLKRQERIAQGALMNTKILAVATVVLALATFGLVLVTVLHL